MLEDLTFKSLGVVNYHETLELMKSHIKSENFKNEIWLLEHPPIFTLGTAADKNHILNAKDIPIVQSDRGGEVTYHGPGQIVIYPILDLENFFTDIHKYLRSLEEAVILTLKDYNIESGRIKDYTGVWIDIKSDTPRKICALGVKTSRWVTMHGLALNVNTDLNFFKKIIPCGINDKEVTSISKEVGQDIKIKDVEKKLLNNLSKVFEFKLIS